MPQAALLTGYDTGYREIASLTVPIMRHYAERHGFIFAAKVFEPTDRAPAWSKIPAIKDALIAGYDPVIWIDADAVIDRHDLNIRDGVDDTKDIWLSPGRNTGVIVIRNTPWSLWFLDEIWRNRLVPEHHWWDQAATEWIFGYRAQLGRGEPNCVNSDVLSHLGQLDRRWNCIPMLMSTHDAFIRHYCGTRHRSLSIRWDIDHPLWSRFAGMRARLLHRLSAFDKRMKRKQHIARLPIWYSARRLAARPLYRSLTSSHHRQPFMGR